MRLTAEQENILNRCLEGHNLVITGQAGTGKSFLVNSIVRALKNKEKSVRVVCSSGLACTVYDRGVAATVHSHYGLQTADLPWEKVVARAKANSVVCAKVQDVDTLIWDEVSMSSARILELANALEHELAKDENICRPFGGKQLILVGDLFQLKPVPSSFDYGDYIFSCNLFRVAFPHRCELTTIMRQKAEEIQLLDALRELRVGECSQRTETFMKSLSRDLSQEKAAEATHIFFLKLSASLHNLAVLRTIPGAMIEIQAEVQGEIRKVVVSCPAERVVRLKKNCRVMLLWNKSELLRNGSQGIFEDMENGCALVRFPGVGVVSIAKETWLKRDRQGNVVGSVTQIPLVAAYGITCHKSQGQTLPAAVVHCSQEFVSGLLYVALSRVKSANDLQVINFHSKFLTRVPQVVTSEQWTALDNSCLKNDLRCCRAQSLTSPTYFHVKDRYSCDEDIHEDEDQVSSMADEDDILSNIFEKDDDCPPISLLNINETMHQHEGFLSKPPESLNVNNLLSTLKNDKAQSGTNGHKKNVLIDELISAEGNNKRKMIAFVEVIWYHLFSILEKFTASDPDDTVKKISRQEFTSVTGDLHSLFKSKEYKAYLHDLFGIQTISEIQTSVGGQLVLALYSLFLTQLADKVHNNNLQDTPVLNVWDMPIEGQAKVRHVGGWALRKVMEDARRYIRQNMFTKDEKTLVNVNKNVNKAGLIQDDLCVQYATIASNSRYPGTLLLTEFRQYRERGLIHISDKSFEFFMHLEQLRIQMICNHSLRKHGPEMIDKALEEIKDNAALKDTWQSCYDADTSHSKELLEEVFLDVLKRNIKMGGNQFLKDFRHQHNVQKTAELRKRVLQRQQKAQEKQDMVKFEDILKDTSHGKVQSHALLSRYLQDHQIEGLVRVYSKSQLQLLCRAYEVQFNSRANKTFLATHLGEVIPSVDSIPLESSFLVSNVGQSSSVTGTNVNIN